MNVDAILQAFVLEEANVILIGGMNFLLRHQPVMTFDVDLWVRDDEANLDRVARALCRLEAAWGRDEHSWKPVPADGKWLRGQTVFCLTTREGAVDIFTEVKGLEGKFTECWQRSRPMTTAGGIPFRSLSDEDVLACQLALREEGAMTSEEKRREEEKRDRMYDPALRWKHIQETITWAEANLPPHLRRNIPRRAKHGATQG